MGWPISSKICFRINWNRFPTALSRESPVMVSVISCSFSSRSCRSFRVLISSAFCPNILLFSMNLAKRLHQTLSKLLYIQKSQSNNGAAFFHCRTGCVHGTQRGFCLVAVFVGSRKRARSAASAEADSQICLVLMHDIPKLHVCCHSRNHNCLSSCLFHASCDCLALSHAVSDYNQYLFHFFSSSLNFILAGRLCGHCHLCMCTYQK